MKLSVIAPVLSFCLLAACGNPAAPGPAATNGGQDNTAIAHHDPAAPNAPEGKLSLNNGKKWKSDASTLSYVKALQVTADSAAALSQPAAGDYGHAAERLQQISNDLIRDCRMSGPDHEALHHWLEPLLDEIKALKQSGAALHLANIRSQLKQFNDYFES